MRHRRNHSLEWRAGRRARAAGDVRRDGHRGPDDEGVYLDGGVGLGMRRLSIIDLEGGHQPIANEDGTVWVVFNGEIYNYRELRRDLEQRGHVFRTSSDTEMIVHLYEEHGAGLRRAAARHVRASRCGTRGRARCCWRATGWASSRSTTPSATASWCSPPSSRRSCSSDTRPRAELGGGLPSVHVPGHAAGRRASSRACRSSSRRGVAVGRAAGRFGSSATGTCTFEPDETATEPELVERLRALLDESVALHLVSDVPVGAFLSGGIDSSAVVATMARLNAQPVKTFSVGFEKPASTSWSYARRVAALIGTEHHELVLEPDVVPLVEDLAWYLDEPFGDPSAIPTYMVSKLAAEHVKVVLTGDGGDEFFAGYDKYVVEERERAYDRVPALAPQGRRRRRRGDAAKACAAAGSSAISRSTAPRRYLDAQSLFPPDESAALFEREASARMAHYDPWAEPMSHLGRRRRLDVGAAVRRSAGLPAARHPDQGRSHDHGALDRGAAAAARSQAGGVCRHRSRAPALPRRHHEVSVQAGDARHPAGRDHRPAASRASRCRWRDGCGGRSWRYRARRAAVRAPAASAACFNPAAIERLLRLHQDGRDLDLQLWTMLSFEMWCRRFLDTEVVCA